MRFLRIDFWYSLATFCQEIISFAITEMCYYWNTYKIPKDQVCIHPFRSTKVSQSCIFFLSYSFCSRKWQDVHNIGIGKHANIYLEFYSSVFSLYKEHGSLMPGVKFVSCIPHHPPPIFLKLRRVNLLSFPGSLWLVPL